MNSLDMTPVEWRIVPGCPDYEISDCGHLRRRTDGSNSKAGKVIRPRIGTTGYVLYGLSEADGFRRTRSAHRMVAEAFLGLPVNETLCCLHRDDDKTNNQVANLRWGSLAENTEDARKNGRLALDENHPCHVKPWTRPRGQTHSSAKLTEDDVRAILNDPRKQRDIAAAYGVDQALIGRIRTKKIWRHITDPDYAARLRDGAARARQQRSAL